MIELEMRNLAGGEILHAYPQGKSGSALPCIIFYHGFTSSRVVYSYFAVALAEAGFRVIMPDAPEHGARFNGDAAGRLQRFWPILLNSCQGFSALRDAIVQQGWLEEGRLAVAGASMGGMTALGIMTHHPELTCGASLMGSGYFTSLSRTLFPSPTFPPELAEWDVGHQLDKLAAKPLMLWHGEDDDVVPAAESFRLQQALKQHGLDGQLTFQWQAGVRHRITPEALDATVAFFRQTL
ncbi:esterase [Scandinavium sp. V105_16]|uniref:Esterase n=1 Tax=Scandinavium lactucae TaxID=3095028 RepID=A0AAJ2S013_9ENTR|nr:MULTISPECIES: esterase [unclassified Scandinavium]MDX6021741.1 esterase [Scandinavium sp. V105_16]MDX6031906.1 esterase [Scandinavium sp. V105_12]MDX6038595.1 esterase [Scandinavium sp. V105_6]MDX6049449.1 esterase [Scandinavium sp. V105_1]